MNQTEFRSLLTLLADGWKHKEYTLVASQFTEDVFYSDPNHYTFQDRESLLAFFEDDDGRQQFCEFHNSLFDEERQIGVAEFTYEGTFRYHGTAWIEIKENKIASWREYQHISKKTWEEFWQK